MKCKYKEKVKDKGKYEKSYLNRNDKGQKRDAIVERNCVTIETAAQGREFLPSHLSIRIL
jgi:hypothetical protein